MNIRIFTVLILITLANVAFSQRHVCGVSEADQQGMIAFVENYNKTANQSTTRDNDPIFVPVKVHMTAENDGSGRVKANSILTQLAVIMEDFKEFGMYMYIYETEFHYLNSTSIYENPGNFQNLIVNQKNPNAINVFFCQNADTNNGGPGTTLGFYSPSGDYLIVRNQEAGIGSSTLTHELGHFFSLAHPFVGWGGVYDFYGWIDDQGGLLPWNVEQFNGMYPSFTCPGNNQPVELVNMSNCEISADRICDTPPDYHFGFGAGGCFWNNSLKDPNGDIVDPQENNFMSYFGNCGDYTFTDGQIDVMFANFNSNGRDHLRSSYIPDTTEIISNHELIYPIDGEVLEFNTNVQLNWSNADGASNYLVSLNSQSGEFTEYFVTESELWLDLDPNSFYFWEVRPFNEGYTDTELKSSFFNTGDGINTAVKESEIIQNVQVFPNPGRRGQDINVSISMEESNDVTISLIDITGKLITSENQRLIQGDNTITIDAMAQSGIYFLKLDSKDGSTHKKIVIQ